MEMRLRCPKVMQTTPRKHAANGGFTINLIRESECKGSPDFLDFNFGNRFKKPFFPPLPVNKSKYAVHVGGFIKWTSTV